MFCIANGSFPPASKKVVETSTKTLQDNHHPNSKPCTKVPNQVWAMPLRSLTPMSCTTFFSKLLVAYQDQSPPSQTSLIRSTRISPDFIGRDLAELIETKAIYKGLLVASTITFPTAKTAWFFFNELVVMSCWLMPPFKGMVVLL